MPCTSAPLLKFVNDKAFLENDGLEKVRSIPGRIYPVILMGDGRAGKSYLASRILNTEDAFASSSSAESVTEGIDICIRDLRELVNSFPDAQTPKALNSKEPMHIMVLDCEGGNNAMAAIRTLVNVFGVIIGTEVLFVAGGSFSEAALQSLEATIAARQLVALDGDSDIPQQRLVFVVNKNTLEYDANTLESALSKEHADATRTEARALIRQTFPDRKFMSIPLMKKPGFEEGVKELRDTIFEDSRPLMMAGCNLTGPLLASLLSQVVKEMENMNEVSMPNMNRQILVDGILKPVMDKLILAARDWGKTFDDYDAELEQKDFRPRFIEQYREGASKISNVKIVGECEAKLLDEFNKQWDSILSKNKVFGEATANTVTESKTAHGDCEKHPVGGGGMLRTVMLTYQTCKMSTRVVVLKKNGKRIEGAWAEGSDDTWELKETSFQGLSTNVPILRGRLLKRSPNVMRRVIGGGYQDRSVVIREGFMVWWNDLKTPAPRATDSAEEKKIKGAKPVQGIFNFLLNNDAVLERLGNTGFAISPGRGGWNDSSSFSGGSSRRLEFAVGEPAELGKDYHPLEKWMTALKANIKWAQKARADLGERRVMEEIGTAVPMVKQAVWQAPEAK